MYTLVKELRGQDLDSLKKILQGKLDEMEESWDGFDDFRLHGQNGRFVKFLLSRITGFIEQESGKSSSFTTYYISPGSKPYEIEHIWANIYSRHQDEFDQQHEFENYRNRMGDLILLPRGTNQSYGAKLYDEKLKHYVKENLLAKSLHAIAYENNPNFNNMAKKLSLPFKTHSSFGKGDIDARQSLYRANLRMHLA